MAHDLTKYDDVKDIVSTISDTVSREFAARTKQRSDLIEIIVGIETLLRYEPTITSMQFLSGYTWWSKKPIYKPIQVTSGWITWAAPNYCKIRIDYGIIKEYDCGGYILIECNQSGTCNVYGHRSMTEIPYPPNMQRQGSFYQWWGTLASNTTSIKEIMESIAKELSLFCSEH